MFLLFIQLGQRWLFAFRPLKHQLVCLLPQGEYRVAIKPGRCGSWQINKEQNLSPSDSAGPGPLREPVFPNIVYRSAQVVHHFLSFMTLILPKTTQQLCPKIKVGLFRFYFLKLSSNYQKVFSSLFSNCWKVPMTSNFPSPGTENSYTKLPCVSITNRDPIFPSAMSIWIEVVLTFH